MSSAEGLTLRTSPGGLLALPFGMSKLSSEKPVLPRVPPRGRSLPDQHAVPWAPWKPGPCCLEEVPFQRRTEPWGVLPRGPAWLFFPTQACGAWETLKPSSSFPNSQPAKGWKPKQGPLPPADLFQEAANDSGP